jgi:hypothetical protein
MFRAPLLRLGRMRESWTSSARRINIRTAVSSYSLRTYLELRPCQNVYERWPDCSACGSRQTPRT